MKWPSMSIKRLMKRCPRRARRRNRDPGLVVPIDPKIARCDLLDQSESIRRRFRPLLRKKEIAVIRILQQRQVRRQKQNVKVGINQTRTHFMGLPRHLAPDICVAIISGLVCAGIELVEKRQIGHNHSAIEDRCTGRLNQLREITSVIDNPFSIGILRSNAIDFFKGVRSEQRSKARHHRIDCGIAEDQECAQNRWQPTKPERFPEKEQENSGADRQRLDPVPWIAEIDSVRSPSLQEKKHHSEPEDGPTDARSRLGQKCRAISIQEEAAQKNVCESNGKKSATFGGEVQKCRAQQPDRKWHHAIKTTANEKDR